MIAVGLALFAQTWLFVGVMGAPIGYTLDVPISTLTHTEFMLAGPPEQLGPARSLKVRFGGFDLQEDWTTSSGEGVRVVERMAPFAVLRANHQRQPTRSRQLRLRGFGEAGGSVMSPSPMISLQSRMHSLQMNTPPWPAMSLRTES